MVDRDLLNAWIEVGERAKRQQSALESTVARIKRENREWIAAAKRAVATGMRFDWTTEPTERMPQEPVEWQREHLGAQVPLVPRRSGKANAMRMLNEALSLSRPRSRR